MESHSARFRLLRWRRAFAVQDSIEGIHETVDAFHNPKQTIQEWHWNTLYRIIQDDSITIPWTLGMLQRIWSLCPEHHPSIQTILIHQWIWNNLALYPSDTSKLASQPSDTSKLASHSSDTSKLAHILHTKQYALWMNCSDVDLFLLAKVTKHYDIPLGLVIDDTFLPNVKQFLEFDGLLGHAMEIASFASITPWTHVLETCIPCLQVSIFNTLPCTIPRDVVKSVKHLVIGGNAALSPVNWNAMFSGSCSLETIAFHSLYPMNESDYTLMEACIQQIGSHCHSASWTFTRCHIASRFLIRLPTDIPSLTFHSCSLETDCFTSFGSRPITGMQKWLPCIPRPQPTQWPFLHSLNLQNCLYGTTPCKQLAPRAIESFLGDLIAQSESLRSLTVDEISWRSEERLSWSHYQSLQYDTFGSVDASLTKLTHQLVNNCVASLESLDFRTSYLQRRFSSETVDSLLLTLSVMPHLKSLKLADDSLIECTPIILAESLAKMSTLETLSLSRDDRSCLDEVIVALGSLHSLKDLCFEYMFDRDDEVDALYRLLEASPFSLTKLYIGENHRPLTHPMTFAGLRHCRMLRALVLENVKLSNACTFHLGQAMQSLSTLQTLVFNRIKVKSCTRETLQSIVKGIANLATLETLRLTSANIHLDFCSHLVGQLSRLHRLSDLNLSDCGLQSSDISALQSSLSKMPMLQCLALSRGKVDASYIAPLLETVSRHCMLEELYLYSLFIRFSVKQQEHAMDILQRIKTLQHLEFQSAWTVQGSSLTNMISKLPRLETLKLFHVNRLLPSDPMRTPMSLRLVDFRVSSKSISMTDELRTMFPNVWDVKGEFQE